MSKRVVKLVFVHVFVLAAFVPVSYVQGQDAAVEVTKILVQLEAAVERTPVESTPEGTAAEARRAGKLVPFRPTMGRDEFLAAKAAVQAGTRSEPGRRVQSQREIAAQAQPVPIFSFNGVDQVTAGGLRPPDTHGAVGTDYFLEVTNSHLDIYTKSGFRVKSVTLASFFGYSTTTLFDPRAIYDASFDRWVIIAPAFAENSTTQRFFIACSKSGDPLGSYYFYNFNVTRNANEFFDYPQLGLHSTGLIVTANIFNGPLVGHHIYTLPLNRMYTGASLLMATFILGPHATIAPPIVLDSNPNAYLVAAPPAGSQLRIYRLNNLLIPSSTTLTGPTTITVAAYGVPPDAQQPGTCATLLDTLDSRFVNASTQVGDSLWNVHTINVATAYGNRARPRFYQIYTPLNMLLQSGTFSTTARSFDFNASIAANANEDAFVNWSATDPTRGVNAQVNVSGRAISDPSGTMGVALPMYTSSTCSTQNRWGDYSAVTLDPTDALAAWVVNETILGPTQWGSRIGKISF